MIAAALLHDGEGTPHRSADLKIAQHEHRITQIADIESRFHRTDQPMLSEDQDGQHAFLPEIAQELMHLKDEESLIRHRVEVTVQTVDDDNPGVILFDALSYIRGEFPGGHLGGIDLLKADESRLQVRFKGQAKRPSPGFHRSATFIEGKEHRMLTTGCRRDRIGQRERRLADTGGAQKKRTGAALEPSSQELVELRIAARRQLTDERGVMFPRDQPGAYPHPSRFNGEIVEAAAKSNAAHLDDAQPPALCSIIDGELFEHHHAMRDRMELQIVLGGREVVEEDA